MVRRAARPAPLSLKPRGPPPPHLQTLGPERRDRYPVGRAVIDAWPTVNVETCCGGGGGGGGGPRYGGRTNTRSRGPAAARAGRSSSHPRRAPHPPPPPPPARAAPGTA